MKHSFVDTVRLKESIKGTSLPEYIKQEMLKSLSEGITVMAGDNITEKIRDYIVSEKITARICSKLNIPAEAYSLAKDEVDGIISEAMVLFLRKNHKSMTNIKIESIRSLCMDEKIKGSLTLETFVSYLLDLINDMQ